MDFNYDKHGLKKGDFMVTLNTFEEPKKLGLVLVRNSHDDGYTFKVIKNVPFEYVLDEESQYFNRVPKGMLLVRGMASPDSDLQYVFVSSVVGCRHFRLPDFQSIR